MQQDSRLSGRELNYVREVLAHEFSTSSGSIMTSRLESTFAARMETDYAIAHINGTATMHALLEAIGVGPGDEVIVPPLTMASTSLAVLQANATPVFADIDRDTLEIDPAAVAEQVTDRTRAIIPVALYGLSPDLSALRELADKHNLFMIEDNAQCFLGTHRDRLVGRWGHAASYSFQSSKHMTSGEGGMVTTDDATVADQVRRVSSLGYAGVGAKKGKITRRDIQDPDYSRHLTLGWNYRMPELCAAVALAQLEQLDFLVAKRIAAARLLAAAVAGCEWLVPQAVPEDSTHTYWSYVVQLRHPSISWHQFRDTFARRGGDGVYSAWKLTYLEPMFTDQSFLRREKFINQPRLRSYGRGLCPTAEDVQPRILQFKTNYWKSEEAERQAEILHATIQDFDS